MQQQAIQTQSNFAVKAGLHPGRSFKEESQVSKRTIADGFRKGSDMVDSQTAKPFSRAQSGI